MSVVLQTSPIERQPSVNLRTRLRRGLSWNLLAAVSSQGSTFGVNVVLANLFGRQLFGRYAIVQSTTLTLSMVAQLATGFTAAKFAAEYRSTDRRKAGRILALCLSIAASMGFLAAIALATLSNRLAVGVFNDPQLRWPLVIAAGMVLFTVLNTFRIGALTGLEGYARLARAAIISACVSSVVVVLGASVGGLTGAIAGALFGVATQWLVLRYVLCHEMADREIKLDYRCAWQERPLLWRFVLPSALSGCSSLPSLWLASVFLLSSPGGYGELALYNAASSLRVMVLFLPNVVNNVGLSFINNQFGRGDHRRFREAFWTNLRITTAIAACGTAAGLLLGPFLLRLFGKEFTASYLLIVFLMLSTLAEGAALPVYQVIQCKGRMWLSWLAIAVPRDACLVLFSYLLAPSHGAVGLAMAYLITSTFGLVIMVVIAMRLGLTLGNVDQLPSPADGEMRIAA